MCEYLPKRGIFAGCLIDVALKVLIATIQSWVEQPVENALIEKSLSSRLH